VFYYYFSCSLFIYVLENCLIWFCFSGVI
jgi:hypothetical protein